MALAQEIRVTLKRTPPTHLRIYRLAAFSRRIPVWQSLWQNTSDCSICTNKNYGTSALPEYVFMRNSILTINWLGRNPIGSFLLDPIYCFVFFFFCLIFFFFCLGLKPKLKAFYMISKLCYRYIPSLKTHTLKVFISSNSSKVTIFQLQIIVWSHLRILSLCIMKFIKINKYESIFIF